MFSGLGLIVIYMRFEDWGLKFLVGWSSTIAVIWRNFRKRDLNINDVREKVQEPFYKNIFVYLSVKFR